MIREGVKLFSETGNKYIDSILWEIEEQSKRFHNTQQWEEDDSIKAIEDKAEAAKEIVDELINSILEIHSLICDAAETGFNSLDGEWATKLYFTNARTYAILKKVGSL